MDSDPRLFVFFMNPLDQSKDAPNDEHSSAMLRVHEKKEEKEYYDLSPDGHSDPSAPCTTGTRLASQIAPACEKFTIGTRAIFPHQDLLGGRRTGLTNSSPALASSEVLGRAPG